MGYVPSIDKPDGASAQQADAGGDDWLCLMAMLNVGSIYWGDGGRLYLLIRRNDLAAGGVARADGAGMY